MENTNYFSTAETSCKCSCGFDIKPLLRIKLNELRTKIGRPLIITSGARCDKHNKAVGGAIKSQHVEGLAVDIKATPLEAYEIIKIAMELGFKGIGIHHKFVHLDMRSGSGVVWNYTV